MGQSCNLRDLLRNRKLVLAAGMYRSASTWLYNAVRLILEATNPNIYACWIDDFDPERAARSDIFVVKLHDPNEELASYASRILTTHRDLRDVARSGRDMGLADSTESMVELLGRCVRNHDFWSARAHFNAAYEDIVSNPGAVVHKVGITVGCPIQRSMEALIVNKLSSLQAPANAITYDKVTLIHPSHRFDGRSGSWRDTIDADTVARIEGEFGWWLRAHSYPLSKDTPPSSHHQLSGIARTMLISYAQNFEDVILWRALGRVKRGFYIDVGAQDPIVDSVSLAFYEHGWRGVHVEPTAYYAEKLRSAREDEEVVQAAIAEKKGEISFWEIAETGLSTGDPAIARKHKKEGYNVRKTRVPCLPLSEILDRFNKRNIHWLKIDVEGMEKRVIEGWPPSSVRPWIVVIESTKPNSPKPNFAVWEPALLALGYEFVYFDGLNRFYVSREHPDLKKYFGPGPNTFDGFVLSEQRLRDERADEVAKLAQTVQDLRERLSMAELQIESLHHSTSWRVTAPLRFVRRCLNFLVVGSWAWLTLRPGSRPRRVARRLVVGLAGRLSPHRRLTALAKHLLDPFPALETRLRAVLRPEASNIPEPPVIPSDVHNLPEAAQRVFLDIQQTLWFDVGDLLWWPHSHVTGIQRTLLSVLYELRAASDLPFSLRFCKYVSGDGFFEADDDAIEACITRLTTTGRAITEGEAVDIPPPSRVRLKAAIRNVLRKIYRRLPAEIAPQSRDLFFAAVNWFRACRAYGAKTVRGSESVTCAFSEGDVLLNIGSSWCNLGYTEGVQEAKQQWGVKYVALIYDVIPWKLPAVMPDDLREQFISWLRPTVRAADLLLTISEHSKADIHDFINAEGATPKNVEVIPLGDKPPGAPTEREPLSEMLTALNETVYVLSVGTLEIRKDHDLLFRVWSQLLERYGDDVPMMVWVGRWGWLVESLQQKIRSSNSLDGKLLVLARISEEELDFLYRNCLFTVYPSQYEGWGLPVAESIAHGKYCVASNSSSIPEVAGDLIDYHDPGDFKGCYELVERAIFDPDYRAKKEAEIRAKYRPHSWADCTNTITKTIESLFLGGTVDLLGLERPPTETGITG